MARPEEGATRRTSSCMAAPDQESLEMRLSIKECSHIHWRVTWGFIWLRADISYREIPADCVLHSHDATGARQATCITIPHHSALCNPQQIPYNHRKTVPWTRTYNSYEVDVSTKSESVAAAVG